MRAGSARGRRRRTRRGCLAGRLRRPTVGPHLGPLAWRPGPAAVVGGPVAPDREHGQSAVGAPQGLRRLPRSGPAPAPAAPCPNGRIRAGRKASASQARSAPLRIAGTFQASDTPGAGPRLDLTANLASAHSGRTLRAQRDRLALRLVMASHGELLTWCHTRESESGARVVLLDDRGQTLWYTGAVSTLLTFL